MSSWPNLLQSPGVPSHTQVREPQSAMRRQEQPPVQDIWSPRSAMEAMNQSGQPRKSGKRGPMQTAPLTSGGLALEEITCRGWGPHLQYSFLIKLASLSGKYVEVYSLPPNGLKSWGAHTLYNCREISRNCKFSAELVIYPMILRMRRQKSINFHSLHGVVFITLKIGDSR